MKLSRLLVLSLAVLAGPAFAQSNLQVTTSSSALTGSAPTVDTDGISINGALGFAVIVSADAAQTITGGSLLCYYYGPVSSGAGSGAGVTFDWMRCPTGFDFTPATGARRAASGDYETLVGWGRIAFVPSSVTVSGGTTVSVTVAVRRVR